MLPELHYTPKKYHLKQNRFDYQLLFERIPWALVDPIQVIERSAEIKPENRDLNTSVSFNYYFFECTLNNTLTAKNGDVSWSTPQVRPA